MSFRLMGGGVGVSLLLLGVGNHPGDAQQAPPAKKLIEFGWDIPNPAYLRENIREMEKQPFEGVIFRLPDERGVIFSKEKRDEADFVQIFEDCRNIEWQKFTDNFLCLYAASDMDWFSDDDWEAVHHNLRLAAKAAVLARCKGFCFDAEPYGRNPWDYPNQAHAAEKSFAEYQAQVRRRGAEFMQTIQEYMPHAIVHTLFQLSIFRDIVYHPDMEKRSHLLSHDHYALLPAFFNGMLDVVAPEIIIADGNESAYYYTSTLDFFRVFHTIRQGALSMVVPENRHKYRTQVQVSQALYMDIVFARGVWGERNVPARGLTPEEQAKFFEHNTYYALQTSDEYVWLYSEQMNWWKNERLPPGLREAVESAKRKIAHQEPLGFEIEDMIAAGREKHEAKLRAQLLRRTADIRRLGAEEKPPILDGKLDDPVWQATAPLEEFIGEVISKDPKPEAPTRAWVAYDNRNLYLAFQCREPKIADLKIVGEGRDEAVWRGDHVNLLLAQGESPLPLVHLRVNPRNAQWDFLQTDHGRINTNPQWQSAAAIGEAEWTAEMVIPWAEVKIPSPVPGTQLGANLCRRRKPGDGDTCWSQTISSFLEEKSLGTWVFR